MIKTEEIVKEYKELCKELSEKPYNPFIESIEENEEANLDLILRGNDKLNFKNRVKDTDLLVITTHLTTYGHFIEHIDLRYNQITDEGASYLAKLLKICPNIVTLNLEGNDIKSDGATQIADALKSYDRLISINLNGNCIQTEGSMSITELLFTNQKLVQLDLGNNEIDHDGMIALSSVINCSNYTLEVLNIDNPRYRSIGQETAIHFGKMLASNVGLQKLSIRKHKLRCDGIYIVMEHLLENSTLKVLDLNANEISVQGMQAISKFLKQENCVLESLHLANNRASDLGAKAIAQAMAINKSLIHIDITYNNINDDGLCRTAESLLHNQTLLSFKLFGNHFGQDSMELFFHLFNNPRENENPWYPDFVVYLVDEHFDMAYVETQLMLDIYVT